MTISHPPIDQLELYRKLQDDMQRMFAKNPTAPRTLEEILAEPTAPDTPLKFPA